MKIRFTRAPELTECSTEEAERFAAGSLHDLPAASAERWIRRGAAEAVAEKAGRKPAPPKASARKA